MISKYIKKQIIFRYTNIYRSLFSYNTKDIKSKYYNEKFSYRSHSYSFLSGVIFVFGSISIYEEYKRGLFSDFLLKNISKARCSTRIYTEEEVSKHKSKSTGIWVTYQNKVYDITNFVKEHPGGDKILLAAGGPVEPYWNLYAVHKDNEEVQKLLQSMEIGELESSCRPKKEDVNDPFAQDPERHPALKVVNKTPFNAETPPELLTEQFITPNSLFFVRNHLPVPSVNIKDYNLQLQGQGLKQNHSFSLDQLKKIDKVPSLSIKTTIMCAGNRRRQMSQYKPVHGLSWDLGAISTAEWTGILLVDLLNYLGVDYSDLMREGARFIQFEGLDKDPATGGCYGSSIPIDLALDPRSQILLAWHMNGEPLPRDHGYPLRVIMPGIIGARQVKWLSKIIISTEESPSFWQQKDYKTFPVNTDAKSMDYSKEMAVMEPNVQSAICSPLNGQIIENNGQITIKGYAWSGAGRGIIRVEVSTDGGETWTPADIVESQATPTSSQISRQQWCWVLWELTIELPEKARHLEFICKAVDSSQNSQPETYKGTWNVRGLMSNAWHRVSVEITDPSDMS